MSTSLLVGSIFSSMFESVAVFTLKGLMGGVDNEFVIVAAIFVPSTATSTACGRCG